MCFLCLYVYADAIVDITPQFITLNQKSNQTSVIRTNTQAYKYLQKYFCFFPKVGPPIPKGHFRYRISKCEIHFCL
jgi:hypothetical protein